MYSDDELFDILTPDGKRTGALRRRCDVHRDGDWHGSVHIWVIRELDGDVEVLVQKRSEMKDSYPGCYDAAATGHIDAGEDALRAALRELGEELGIVAKPADLILLDRLSISEDNIFNGKRFINNEICWVYLYNAEVFSDDIRFEEAEISAVEWQAATDILEALDNGDSNYCLGKEELKAALRCINDIKE